MYVLHYNTVVPCKSRAVYCHKLYYDVLHLESETEGVSDEILRCKVIIITLVLSDVIRTKSRGSLIKLTRQTRFYSRRYFPLVVLCLTRTRVAPWFWYRYEFWFFFFTFMRLFQIVFFRRRSTVFFFC